MCKCIKQTFCPSSLITKNFNEILFIAYLNHINNIRHKYFKSNVKQKNPVWNELLERMNIYKLKINEIDWNQILLFTGIVHAIANFINKYFVIPIPSSKFDSFRTSFQPLGANIQCVSSISVCF